MVAEKLPTVSGALPAGVTTAVGPDATALGQIYYYVLKPPPGMNLAELRTKQDFFIKYSLQSVKGVAEVASIGGYVKTISAKRLGTARGIALGADDRLRRGIIERLMCDFEVDLDRHCRAFGANTSLLATDIAAFRALSDDRLGDVTSP